MRAIFALLLLACVAAAASPLTAADAEHDWRKCEKISVLGELCEEVYVDPDLLEVGIRVLINNHTVFDRHWEAGKLCATEKELLKLLELIPALAPYKTIIDEVIKIWGRIPADVFSICAELYNESWVQKKFHACAKVDLKIICWNGSCVYKKVHDLGCFTIPK